jgi:hypothetical protein
MVGQIYIRQSTAAQKRKAASPSKKKKLKALISKLSKAGRAK